MEWDEYKVLCERPDHFSRWALNLTAASIEDPATRRSLAEAVRGVPLDKPAGHHGGSETDYFAVDIALQQAEVIVRQVGETSAACEGKQQRRLNHLQVVWREYTALPGN